MFTESVATVPNALVTEYLQTATLFASDEIRQSFEQKLSSHSLRNTMVRLTEEGYIFQFYASSGGISPDRGSWHYVESLPEPPHISFKGRESVDHDVTQIDSDICTWGDSCSDMCVIVLKRKEYVTAINGVRHLSALLTKNVLGIPGKSAE